MSLSQQQLEERVIFLEEQMDQVKKILSINTKKSIPWWENIAGTFLDNVAFEEAMELVKQYSQSDKSSSGLGFVPQPNLL